MLGDTSATELDATNAPGLYAFDLAQAETNADKLVFSAKSSTSGIRVVPVTVYTRANHVNALVIDSSGNLSGSVGSVTGNVGGNVVGSVASVAGAVGSVTGNVGGNVTGSVGSVSSVTNIQSGLATAAALATVAGYIDTEVAAIQTAVVTDIPATLAVIAGYIDTEVAAIKLKTDTLPASFPANFPALVVSAAGVVSADVKKVNGTALTGDGSGTPWGPA